MADGATLRTVYAEICKTHNAIADFRGKLLTLLPIASGASVFLLLGKLNGGDRKLLLAVGLSASSSPSASSCTSCAGAPRPP